MMFRNTFKLLFSNANLIWKSGIYKFICVLLVSLISLNFLSPVVESLKEETLIVEAVTSFFNGFATFNGVVIAQSFNQILQIMASDVVVALKGNIWLVLILLLIVLPFLIRLSNIADCEYLYGSMSSNTTYSYTNCFIRSLKKAIKLEVTRLIITVPFSVLLFGGALGLSTLLCTSEKLSAFAPFVLTFFFVLLIAIKKSAMAGIEGAIVVKDYSTFKAYKKGLSVAKRNFGEVFLTEFVMTLLVLFINVMAASYTFGVGLIVTLPVTAVIFSILKMVAYYTAEGMDFYYEPNAVYRSKKFGEQLTIKRNKYII